MKTVGVVIAERGAAIVDVERSADDALLVTGIERLPADLAAVAERLGGLDPDACYTVDADGLGNAVWAVLEHPYGDRRGQLYTGRGIERQTLVDELLVVMHEGRFHFAPGLAEQPAMSKALLGYRRQVREDGLIGSELVVALLLAIRPPKPEPQVWVHWGRNPFGPDREDDAEGLQLGPVRFERGPDGVLVGYLSPRPSDPK